MFNTGLNIDFTALSDEEFIQERLCTFTLKYKHASLASRLYKVQFHKLY